MHLSGVSGGGALAPVTRGAAQGNSGQVGQLPAAGREATKVRDCRRGWRAKLGPLCATLPLSPTHSPCSSPSPQSPFQAPPYAARAGRGTQHQPGRSGPPCPPPRPRPRTGSRAPRCCGAARSRSWTARCAQTRAAPRLKSSQRVRQGQGVKGTAGAWHAWQRPGTVCECPVPVSPLLHLQPYPAPACHMAAPHR